MICPDCEGKGTIIALVDGAHYRGPMSISCSRCSGTGEADLSTERWLEIGGTHRTWRVAQHEGLQECAVRLGIPLAELLAMESGRADPARLLLDTPEELRATDGGTAPDRGLSPQQLDEALAWLLK